MKNPPCTLEDRQTITTPYNWTNHQLTIHNSLPLVMTLALAVEISDTRELKKWWRRRQRGQDGRIAIGLGYVHAKSDTFCARTKTIPDKALFAHTNGDFGAISATVRTAPRRIFWCSVNRLSDPSKSEKAGARSVIHWNGSKYSGVRTGIYFTKLPANCSGTMFDVFQRLVPVLCRRCSYYT